VDVELVGGAQRPFLGFMLQARDVATDRPIGTFTLPSGAQAKYLNCANNRQVGVPTGYHWPFPKSYTRRNPYLFYLFAYQF
jgi:hypothetical protein